MSKTTKKKPRTRKPKKEKRLTPNQHIKLLTANIAHWCTVEKTRSKRYIYTSHNNRTAAENSADIKTLMDSYNFGLQYTI